MGRRSLIEMRLIRGDHRVRASWTESVDPLDADEMRDVLRAAVRTDMEGDPDWKQQLGVYELGWRWGSSSGWRSFRAST